jgi:polysaccharide export outer membrane protein
LSIRCPVAGALCALLVACSAASTGFPYANEPDPSRSEYVIGVTDALSVRVWRNTDLTLDTTVMPDGTITMPLIGPMQVAGKTSSQVRELIARSLKAYIKDEGAVVTVSVTRVNSYRVAVSGNVERPGVIESTRYLTVSEAILLAGGPNRFASPNDSILVRVDPDGRSRRIPIQYGEIQAGRRPEQDLVLLRGDRIYVP